MSANSLLNSDSGRTTDTSHYLTTTLSWKQYHPTCSSRKCPFLGCTTTFSAKYFLSILTWRVSMQKKHWTTSVAHPRPAGTGVKFFSILHPSGGIVLLARTGKSQLSISGIHPRRAVWNFFVIVLDEHWSRIRHLDLRINFRSSSDCVELWKALKSLTESLQILSLEGSSGLWKKITRLSAILRSRSISG